MQAGVKLLPEASGLRPMMGLNAIYPPHGTGESLSPPTHALPASHGAVPAGGLRDGCWEHHQVPAWAPHSPTPPRTVSGSVGLFAGAALSAALSFLQKSLYH